MRYPCAGCRHDKRADAFDAVDVTAYVKKPKAKKLLCLECSAKGCTARDTKVYQCSRCKKDLGRSKFEAQQLNNFLKGQRLFVQCKDCQGLRGDAAPTPVTAWTAPTFDVGSIFYIGDGVACSSDTQEASPETNVPFVPEKPDCKQQ